MAEPVTAGAPRLQPLARRLPGLDLRPPNGQGRPPAGAPQSDAGGTWSTKDGSPDLPVGAGGATGRAAPTGSPVDGFTLPEPFP